MESLSIPMTVASGKVGYDLSYEYSVVFQRIHIHSLLMGITGRDIMVE